MIFFPIEYTSYIRALQTILADGQEVILNLSRGYKTAARVDHEWKKKMIKIISEVGIHTYISLTLYPRSGRGISDILDTHVLPKLVSYEEHCRRDRW
jgi:hypothetical protein